MTTSAVYFIGFFVCLIAIIATNPYNKDNTTNAINVVLITFESLLALLTVIFVCISKSLTCYQPKNPPTRSFAINQNAIRLNTISENQNNQQGRDSFASQVPPYSFYGNTNLEETGEDLPPYNPEKFSHVKSGLQDEATKQNLWSTCILVIFFEAMISFSFERSVSLLKAKSQSRIVIDRCNWSKEILAQNGQKLRDKFERTIFFSAFTKAWFILITILQ